MNTMHMLAASLLFLQLAVTPTTEQKPREDAVIEGVVFRLDTGEPLRRAQVTLTPVRPPVELGASPPADSGREQMEFPPVAPAITGSDGVFRFAKLPPGTYRLSVKCNGYVATEYGNQTSAGQGTIIALTAGQVLKDISLRLRPAATVSGHVRDSEGIPLTNVSVSLVKRNYFGTGIPKMEEVASSITDDRGEYRMFWVSPGRYYLAAVSTDIMLRILSTVGNAVPEKAFPPYYYPGTFDISRATIIDVLPGADLDAMNIVLTRPATYRIQGTIAGMDGGKPPRAVQVVLHSQSKSENSADYPNAASQVGNVTYGNGAFEISNVLPGSYLLHASTVPDFDAPLPAIAVSAIRTTSDLLGVAYRIQSSDEIPVEISGSDITGLKLTLKVGVHVPLHVSLEGRDLSALKDPETFRVSLVSRRYQWDAQQHGPLNSDGTGTIEDVRNGEYRVTIEERNPDIYIKEATIDSTDALNGFWKLADTPNGVLNLVLDDKTGRIEGTLTDVSSKPVPGIQVVLIPERFRHRNELYQTVDTDEKGRFVFRAIVPGDYRIFSWEAIEPNAWFDHDLLSKFEQQGKFVHVSEASLQSVDIKLIPAPKE